MCCQPKIYIRKYLQLHIGFDENTISYFICLFHVVVMLRMGSYTNTYPAKHYHNIVLGRHIAEVV